MSSPGPGGTIPAHGPASVDYGPDSIAFTASDLVQKLASGSTPTVTGNGAVIVFDPKTGLPVGDPIPVGPGPSSVVATPH